MEKNRYQKIVEKNKPTEDRLKNGLKAFIVGGIMGIIGQALLEFYSYILEIPTKEAGTFMIAAVATKGDITIKNVIPKHLESIGAKLKEMGAIVEEGDDSVRVYVDGALKGVSVKTAPYPGFPTDVQQPMSALLSIVNGKSLIAEKIWESRHKHIEELNKMGANIKVEGRTAIIEGVDKLVGASVVATDLRAGAAMVIAGLVAEGETEILDIEHIDRGYPHIENKFTALGANIIRVER